LKIYHLATLIESPCKKGRKEDKGSEELAVTSLEGNEKIEEKRFSGSNNRKRDWPL
jgi:hypothetical protein